MEHVVFFPAQDGTPAFRRVASLEDAVRLVEHLRNVEGINEVSVHALTEVPLAFKAWYRVEVPASAPVAVEAAPEPAPEPFPSFEIPSIVPDLALVPAVAPDAPVVAESTDVAEVAELPEAPELVDVAVADLVPEQSVEALAASNGHPAERSRTLGFFTS